MCLKFVALYFHKFHRKFPVVNRAKRYEILTITIVERVIFMIMNTTFILFQEVFVGKSCMYVFNTNS